MRGRKWTVTAVVVVLMVVGAVVSTLFVRRSVHQEQQRVRDAVARWYGTGASVDVVSCTVAPTPQSETNAATPLARYDCVIVLDGCRQTRRFAVAVESNGTPANVVGKPVGPPRPRHCS
jgi:hypothetical protein